MEILVQPLFSTHLTRDLKQIPLHALVKITFLLQSVQKTIYGKTLDSQISESSLKISRKFPESVSVGVDGALAVDYTKLIVPLL